MSFTSVASFRNGAFLDEYPELKRGTLQMFGCRFLTVAKEEFCWWCVLIFSKIKDDINPNLPKKTGP